MNKIRVILKTINDSPTLNGVPRWNLLTNQGYFSVWDEEVANSARVLLGKPAEIEYNQKQGSKYRNVVRIAAADVYTQGESFTSSADHSAISASFPLASESYDKQNSIMAQCALKCAVELAVGKVIESKDLELEAVELYKLLRKMCDMSEERD